MFAMFHLKNSNVCYAPSTIHASNLIIPIRRLYSSINYHKQNYSKVGTLVKNSKYLENNIIKRFDTNSVCLLPQTTCKTAIKSRPHSHKSPGDHQKAIPDEGWILLPFFSFTQSGLSGRLKVKQWWPWNHLFLTRGKAIRNIKTKLSERKSRIFYSSTSKGQK